MAFEKIGLGGVLEFNSRNAVSGMYRAGRAFDTLQTRAGKLGRAAGGATLALGGLGIVTAPIALAAKSAAEQYIAFDNAMASLSSVTGKAKDQLKAQREEAMRLGSATKFTATEIVGGFESLARAGFDSKQQIDAMTGVAMMAQAENLKLAQSANIVSNSVRMFGLEAGEAGRVADVLSFVSSKSNTNILELGNATRYAGPRAAALGMKIEELSATLGIMANQGLKGSMAGTSLDNMFRAIAKPTKGAADWLDKYNIKLKDSKGNFVGTARLVEKLNAAFQKIADPNDRLRMQQEVLGQRGARAFNALNMANNQVLDGKDTDNLDSLMEKIGAGAAGSAARRAELMMQSLAGQMTLLKSASEGLVIRIFDEFEAMDGGMIKPLVDGLQNFNMAWDALSKNISGSDADIAESLGMNVNMVKFVRGVRDGIELVRSSLQTLTDKAVEFGSKFNDMLGTDGARTLGKMVTVFAALAVGSTPVIAALLGIAFVVSTVVLPAVSALATAVSAAFWPVLIAVAAVGAAYFALRNENESFMEWGVRMWTAISAAAMDFYHNALLPLWNGILYGAEFVWPMIRDSAINVMEQLRGIVNEVMWLWITLTGDTAVEWQAIGETLMLVAGIATDVLLNTIGSALSVTKNAIKDVRMVITNLFDGNITAGLIGLGQIIVNTLALPFRIAAAAVGGLINTILDLPGIDNILGDKAGLLRLGAAELTSFGEKGFRFTEHLDDLGITNSKITEAPDLAGEIGADYGKKIAQEERKKRQKDELAKEQEAKRREEELQLQRENEARGKRKEKEGCTTNLHLDGKRVARNQSQHQQDLSDRMGFKTPPFIRRTAAQQGRIGN